MKQKKVPGFRWPAVQVVPKFYVGTAALWLVFTLIANVFLGFDLGMALIGGLLNTGLYWLSELVHQWGHAWAAHRTGYPMERIIMGGMYVVGPGLYPRDEPELPADIHIRRALGGMPASFMLALLFGLLALLFCQGGGLLWFLTLATAVENLLIFGAGAMLPLGFTDGSTLLHYWRQR